MLPLNKTLSGALQDVEEAKERAREVLAREQGKCAHPLIYTTDYERLEYFASLNARRICAHCLVEEEAQGSSQFFETLKGSNPAPDRVIAQIDRRALYAMRPGL